MMVSNRMNKKNLIFKEQNKKSKIKIGKKEHDISHIEDRTWDVVDSYFQEQSDIIFTRHQIESFNYFIENLIPDIITQANPIVIYYNYLQDYNKYQYEIHLNFDDKYVLDRPIIYKNDGSTELMTPAISRIRNLTYASMLHLNLNVTVRQWNAPDYDNMEVRHKYIDNIEVGHIPIMVRSKYCVLHDRTSLEKESLGECKHDQGGYFIINGSEKVVISQERIADNKVHVFMGNKGKSAYIVDAEIKSVPDNRFMIAKNLLVRLRSRDHAIMVHINNFKDDIPLFVCFRALGLESDLDIVRVILYNINASESNKMYKLIQPSLEYEVVGKDGICGKKQSDALGFMLQHIKMVGLPKEVIMSYDEQIGYVKKALLKEFLPHAGTSFMKKAYFLGYMVNKLIKCYLGMENYDVRDSYINKRVDTPGLLLGGLFRQHFNKLVTDMKTLIMREFRTHKMKNDVFNIINKNNIYKIIKSTTIDNGLRYSLSTGNWGMKKASGPGKKSKSKAGTAQVLNRLNFTSALSHLRRVNSPSEKSGKIIPPRMIHSSQWGYICYVETPEGSSVGLVKNMSNMGLFTTAVSSEPVKFVLNNYGTELIENINIKDAYHKCKIFVNGNWYGLHTNPEVLVPVLRNLRREGLLHIYTSVYWNHGTNEVFINTDGGRAIRPLYIVEDNKLKLTNEMITKLKKGIIDWNKLVCPYLHEKLCVNSQEVIENMREFCVKELEESYEHFEDTEIQVKHILNESMVKDTSESEQSESESSSDEEEVIELSKKKLLKTKTKLKEMSNKQKMLLKKRHEVISESDSESENEIILKKYKKIKFNTKNKEDEDDEILINVEKEDDFDSTKLSRDINADRMKEALDNYNKVLGLFDTNSVIEYIDPEETQNCLISMNIRDLNNQNPLSPYNYRYTHCEIHPSVVYGVLASLIPFPDHNQSPRNTYQSAMGKQAIGVNASNYRDKMETLSYTLHYPERPLVYSRMSEYLSYNDLPMGRNSIVAIMTYGGYNQEDSILVNQSAIDRGLYHSTFYRTYKDEEKRIQSSGQEEIFGKSPHKHTKGRKPGSYDKLDEEGFVETDAYMNGGDAIIGKMIPIKGLFHGDFQVFKDASTTLRANESGYVDKVCTDVNADGFNFCKVKMRSMREPMIGDKFSCYDVESEILTWNGWKLFKDLNENDKVASLVDDTKLVYEKPSAIQSYDYKGKMYCVDSAQINVKVTPNHRMYVRPKTNGSKYRVELAEDIYGKVRKYKKNCQYYENGKAEKKYFTIPAYNDRPAMEIPMDEWLIFFGIWIAEGCMTRDWAVTFSAHKQRVKDALEECANVFGWEIVKHKDRRQDILDKYNFKDIRLINFFMPLAVGAINKYLPDWVWSLSTRQCRLLIHGMCLGDGHVMENGTRRYDTSSIKLANDFQRLCTHAGWAASLKLKYKAGHSSYNSVTKKMVTSTVDSYRLTIITSQLEPIVNKYKTKGKQLDSWEEYDDKVYCCTVKSGLIFTRRKGMVSVQGNSRSGQKGTVGMTYLEEDMPYMSNGIKPDIIMNPHAIPSRMTMAQLMECLLGKVCPELGIHSDCTPYSDVTVDDIANLLEKNGMSRYGDEILYNGQTGEQMNCMIFIGPTFYQRLKHMVSDKMHCLSMDHEVLTNNGWKYFKDIDRNYDTVATLDVKPFNRRKCTYQKPTMYHYYEKTSSSMYHIKNKHIDTIVTSKHRFLINYKGDDHITELQQILSYMRNAVFNNTKIYMYARYEKHCGSCYNKKFEIKLDHINTHKTGEPVFCLSVPNEIFCVRRNGKAYWTGNSRSAGPMVLMTRQPAEGRSRDGGLRLGEMERDCLLAHGTITMLKERTVDYSDNYRIYVCDKCGLQGIVNPAKEIYICSGCETETGFSEVRVPYAYKLLMQELQGMAIVPRLVME